MIKARNLWPETNPCQPIARVQYVENKRHTLNSSTYVRIGEEPQIYKLDLIYAEI